jgi:N-acetylneuraminic acid mutarotase
MKISFLKYKSLTLAGAALLFLTTACSSDDDADDLGNWITSTVFDGSPRSSSVAFVMGNYAYSGTGYNGDDYLSDFWQYDIQGQYWVQKADVPGEARSSAVAFTVNGYGYIGTGYTGTTELKDFYKYDATANSWTPIADFGGTKRRAGVGFNSSAYGYVGSGFDGDNDKKDFWKYIPETDTWQEVLGFGGNKRREAVTFTIGENVYFGTGSSNSIYLDDFWAFNTTSETWTRLKDIDDNDDYSIARANAVGFAIGSYGYISGGDSNTAVWEYNPATDLWTKKTVFEGAERQDAVAFSTGDRGFVLLGRSGNYYFDDMFEFRPFEKYDDED